MPHRHQSCGQTA
ncbi:hypothetical protein YPPY45_4085, partial [Yersinia pestis PY-45]